MINTPSFKEGIILTRKLKSMKIEIELQAFKKLPSDQQILVYRLIQNSIKAISEEFCIKSRCWGSGNDDVINWCFEEKLFGEE